jgi:hypothetical protein
LGADQLRPHVAHKDAVLTLDDAVKRVFRRFPLLHDRLVKQKRLPAIDAHAVSQVVSIQGDRRLDD